MKTLNNERVLLSSTIVLILMTFALSTYSYHKAFVTTQKYTGPLAIQAQVPSQTNYHQSTVVVPMHILNTSTSESEMILSQLD